MGPTLRSPARVARVREISRRPAPSIAVPPGASRLPGLVFLRRALIGLTLAALLLGRKVSSFLVPSTSYYYHWDSLDGRALLLSMALLSVVVIALCAVCGMVRARISGLVLDLAFLLVLADGLLTTFRPPGLLPDGEFRWFAAAVLCGLLVFVPLLGAGARARLVGFAKALTLVLVPLPIAVVALALSVPEWGSSPEAPAATAHQHHPGRPVFLFIFDMWSYDRSTRDGEFLPPLKNLRTLAGQSLWFSRAYSRSFQTEHSLPAILYQSDREFLVRNGGTFWRSGTTLVPTTHVPSLFGRAHDHGYHTALVGFYHPYRKVLGDQLDYCDTRPYLPKGKDLLGRMGTLALEITRTLADPILPVAADIVRWRSYRQNWHELNVRTLKATEELIDGCPPDTFAVFHWPYPHSPYVFDADGGFRSVGLTDFRALFRKGGPWDLDGDPEEYAQAMRQVDRFVGRVTASLRASGKYDDATIILTSDHSWRTDPLPTTDRGRNPHVPLLIKMPHQTAPRVIDQPVTNYGLADLIEGLLSGGPVAARAVDAIAAGKSPGPPG